MRLQLRLGDEAMQQEIEKRVQEEKDEVIPKICLEGVNIFINI